MKFKKGDIVTADMGAGRQRGKIVGSWALGHMVRFDEAPPREFNMGENPTALFDSWLEPITPEDDLRVLGGTK